MTDGPLTFPSPLAPDPEMARRRANVEMRRFQVLQFMQIPIAFGVSLLVALSIFRLPYPIGLLAAALILPACLMTIKLLRNAAWGIYLIYFVELYRPQDEFRFLRAFKPSFVVVGLVFVVFLLRFFTAKRRRIIWTTHSTALLLFVGVMGITVFMASNTYTAYGRFFGIVPTFISFVLVTNLIDTRGKFRTFVRCLMGLYVALTLRALMGYLRGGASAFAWSAGSFLGDENDCALAILTFVPFGYNAMVLWKGRFKKLLGTSVFFLLVLGVILSLSRGGAVGLAVVLAYCWWHSKKRAAILVALVLVFGLLIPLMPQGYWKEMSTMQQTKEGTAKTRRDYWEAGWRMYLDHPVLGVGIGNSSWALPEYFPGRNPGTKWGRALHGTYHELLAELGTIGALAFLFLVGTVWRSLRKSERVTGLSPDDATERDFIVRSVRGALIGYFVAATFLSSLYYPHLYILASVAALARIHYDTPKPAAQTAIEPAA